MNALFKSGDAASRRYWWIELGLLGLVMLEAFLPLRVFNLRMGVATTATMIASLAAGYAVLRGAYSLLARALTSRWQKWASLAPALLGLAVVSVGGLLHGQPHYAVRVTIALASLSTIAVFVLFGPRQSFLLRTIGWGLCLALYLLLLIFVDLNTLSLYPRQVSVFCMLLAATCLFTTFAVVPLPPRRRSAQALIAGGTVAVLCLAVAPAQSARVAGYLRRQAELGSFFSPGVWVRAGSQPPYLIWASDVCPAPDSSPIEVEGIPKPYNVLFISIDTLRHDFFLSPGQSLSDTYPNLAAVATEGCSYANTYSLGAATHMVMPALYNGTFTWPLLQRPLLATLAKRAGLYGRVYGSLNHITDYTGLPEGAGDPQTMSVTDRMLLDMRNAAEKREPWMLIAHYLDLHLPGKTELLAQFRRDLRPFYAQKLAAVDAEIGRLFGAIKSRGEWDRTIVVITADHGEELNERGYSEHGFHLYDTVLRVPLITRVPGQTCIDRQTPISLLDVAPLVAHGLGLQLTSRALNGRWPPDANAPHYAYSSTGGPFLAIRENGQKIIVDARYGDVEVYDLATDPGEENDLAVGLTPAIAARIERTPLPWEPLSPLDQRFRRANGTALDICPPPAPPPRNTPSPLTATSLP